MWLVVDTNQAQRIPAKLRPGRLTGRAKGLTLPPYLLAEVLLRGPGPRRETLAALRQYPVRIGAQSAEVMETVAKMQANQIPRFEPFPVPGSELDALSRRLLDEDQPSLSPGAEQWASKIKAAHLSMATDFVGRADRARKALKEKKAGKAETFNEVLGMADGPESFVASLALSTLSHGNKRPLADGGDPARLYRAMMKNPYLRHFFHGMLVYVVSISRMWRDQRLNRDPQSDVDDWTDLMIGLYTGDGDAVISADGLVKEIFTMIDSRVRVLHADAL